MSARFSSRLHLRAQQRPYELDLVFQIFSHALWHSSSVGQNDNGPLLSFQGSSLSTSSFYTSNRERDKRLLSWSHFECFQVLCVKKSSNTELWTLTSLHCARTCWASAVMDMVWTVRRSSWSSGTFSLRLRMACGDVVKMWPQWKWASAHAHLVSLLGGWEGEILSPEHPPLPLDVFLSLSPLSSIFCQVQPHIIFDNRNRLEMKDVKTKNKQEVEGEVVVVTCGGGG